MLQPTRILSFALSALCLVACDNAYDLSKDINTDIKFGDQFRVPVGNTDTIRVSRIIEESETLSERNGIYEVSSKGSTETAVEPFDAVSVHNFTPVLNSIPLSVTQSGTLPSGTQIDMGSISSSGTYDIYEELPTEVDSLYRADFKGGSVQTFLQLSLPSFPQGVEAVTFSDLTLTFPEFLKLSNGTNIFNASEVVLTPTNNSSQMEISIEMLDMNIESHDTYIVESNGRKHLLVTDAIELTANASITLGGEVIPQDFEVSLAYYMNEEAADINRIAGVFHSSANISTNIAINDIPDFLLSDNTSLSPQEVYVYLDLDNPVNATGYFTLDMTSTKSNQTGSAAASIEVQPISMNNILISNYDAVADGYTTVVEPSLVNLFQFVPENIEINSDDLRLASKERTQMITLGERYAINADYRAVVPFKFNNLSIEYTDSIDNLLSDLEDIADKTDRLIVRGIGVTDIPTNLSATVHLYDIDGNELDGIDVNVDNFRFNAAADGGESTNDLEILLTEQEGSNDLERLEKIVYNIHAASTENITLRPDQYLIIKEIFVEVPDGINITL